MKTISQAQTKLQNGIATAGAAYVQGTGAVTTSPAQLAVAQQAKMVANWNAALPKWAANLGAVTLADYKATTSAAQGKYTGSAALAAVKWGKKMAKFWPLLAQMKAESQAAGGGIAGSQAALTFLKTQAQSING